MANDGRSVDGSVGGSAGGSVGGSGGSDMRLVIEYIDLYDRALLVRCVILLCGYSLLVQANEDYLSFVSIK